MPEYKTTDARYWERTSTADLKQLVIEKKKFRTSLNQSITASMYAFSLSYMIVYLLSEKTKDGFAYQNAFDLAMIAFLLVIFGFVFSDIMHYRHALKERKAIIKVLKERHLADKLTEAIKEKLADANLNRKEIKLLVKDIMDDTESENNRNAKKMR